MLEDFMRNSPIYQCRICGRFRSGWTVETAGQTGRLTWRLATGEATTSHGWMSLSRLNSRAPIRTAGAYVARHGSYLQAFDSGL